MRERERERIGGVVGGTWNLKMRFCFIIFGTVELAMIFGLFYFIFHFFIICFFIEVCGCYLDRFSCSPISTNYIGTTKLH